MATAVCVLAALAVAAPSGAAPLIMNGGFEFGLTSWTTSEQTGSDGTFVAQPGTTSPVIGAPVPAPPEGTNAAMSEGGAGGSRVLYQDVVVPVGVSTATLSFQWFVDNDLLYVTDYFVPTPASLDFAGAARNQQARVDILSSSVDPFSVVVLLNVFQTNPGDALTSGYNLLTTDVSALLAANGGQTLRLRFTAVDNVGPFRFGIDAVSLETRTVPEPTLLALLGMGLAFAGTRRLRV